MMEFLKMFCRIIDALNDLIGRMVAWSALLLVILVFSTVVMRYGFKISYVWMQELIWWLFSFIFLIGAGYTLLHDAHVRVDIVYQRVGFKGRAWVNLIGTVFFLIPGCVLVIYTSLGFVSSSFASMEGSLDPGGLPYTYIVKSLIPIGFSLLLIQGFSLGLHSFLQIAGREEDVKKRGLV
jgi:TRAP-type mannitol/chloroaromatic compound transport system permease small subunit